ncbi:hypothetical protein AX16_003266 [Volvariella volvacea WC 439]|nr:hypothetical protein AX16_003266 [Volvariella volvacea WC 439]
MSDAKRKSEGGGDERKKKKYRVADGTPIWAKRSIDGPGVWVSCVKGKEKQTAGEVIDLFESLASELWPSASSGVVDDKDSDEEDRGGEAELSLEDQIAKEVSAMKAGRKVDLFSNCATNTQCVVFISCKPPVDPVKLVTHHVKNVQRTGVSRTRYTQRLVPVSGSCVTNLPEIQALCESVFKLYFSQHEGKSFKYKIELRIRNHTTLTRQVLIQHVARCMPQEHTVDLQNPDIFVLVEVFKSVCGVSIVEDYYKLQKFNVMEIANAENTSSMMKGKGRVGLPAQSSTNTTEKKGKGGGKKDKQSIVISIEDIEEQSGAEVSTSTTT